MFTGQISDDNVEFFNFACFIAIRVKAIVVSLDGYILRLWLSPCLFRHYWNAGYRLFFILTR